MGAEERGDGEEDAQVASGTLGRRGAAPQAEGKVAGRRDLGWAVESRLGETATGPEGPRGNELRLGLKKEVKLGDQS